MASGCPRQARLPLRWRLVFLSVYALHNAWNCWVFLNFSNFAPAKALLQSTDEQIGFITTVGWLGICATLPLVAVCSWHRTLLVAACLVNSLAPIVRYLTVDVCYQRAKGGALLVHNGQSCSYGLVVLSSFLSGAAFGVLGAWPSILGAQWPEERCTLVTAVASLANYVGGAAGTLYMPARVTNAAALLRLFRQQAYVGASLALLSFCYVRLPPVLPPKSPGAAGGAAITLRQQLRRVGRGRAPLQLCTLGLLVGLSLVLQGMLPFVLSGVGFSDLQSGTGNAVYQLAAAVVGTLLGSQVGSQRQLTAALRGLHVGVGLTTALLLCLCWRVRGDAVLRWSRPEVAWGSPTVAWGEPAMGAMLLLLAMLGATLMGALPFALQQCCLTSAPAGENLVSGLLYLVAMPVAASLTQLCSTVSPLRALAIISALIVLELLAFFAGDPQSRLRRGRAASRGGGELAVIEGGGLRQGLLPLGGYLPLTPEADHPRGERTWSSARSALGW